MDRTIHHGHAAADSRGRLEINLSQLEAFAETCLLGSYTRAAEQLYISQPALHHKVKLLERELGVPLLVVRDRRVVPTSDGELVLRVAEEVLQKIRQIEEHFRHAFEERSVRVGAVSLLAATILSQAVATYQAQHPGAHAQIVSLDPDDIYDALVSNRVDCAVTYREYVTTDLEIEPLAESHVICVASQRHPLVDGRIHRVEELLHYPIALTHRGMGMRTKVEAWFREVAGVEELPVAFEARTGALLAQVAAASSEFITFLPEASRQQFNLEEIPLEGPQIPSSPVICYLPAHRHRPAVDAFLNVLRQTAGPKTTPEAAEPTRARSAR